MRWVMIAATIFALPSITTCFVRDVSWGSQKNRYASVAARAASHPTSYTAIFQSSSDEGASSSGFDMGMNHVIFDYCPGCRWFTRSCWMAQELLTTFNDDNLSAVTLVPTRDQSGRFVVTHDSADGSSTVLWDRKEQGGFPKVKALKQLVRDKIDPDRFLGHSDTGDRQSTVPSSDRPADESSPTVEGAIPSILPEILAQVPGPNISIKYCTGCRWMLRSAYFATELTTNFEQEINSVTLIPSRPPEKGGIFTVSLDGQLVWDREEQGGFPETKELKQLIRDILIPSKDLGHSDRKPEDDDDGSNEGEDELDDDEAAELRSFYGVL